MSRRLRWKLDERPRWMKTIVPHRLLLRRETGDRCRVIFQCPIPILTSHVFEGEKTVVLMRLRFPCLLFHLFPKTQRSHVGPDFFDIGQAVRLGTDFSHVLPTQRIFPFGRPDRVLLLVVHNNLINRIVLSLFHTVSFSLIDPPALPSNTVEVYEVPNETLA